MTDRITTRLGTLLGPLTQYAERHGIPLSQAIRRLLAQALGQPEPDIPANGFVAMTDTDRKKHAKHAARSRWQS